MGQAQGARAPLDIAVGTTCRLILDDRVIDEEFRISMVGVAQLVRALGCGPRGCRFKSGHSPSEKVRWEADLLN